MTQNIKLLLFGLVVVIISVVASVSVVSLRDRGTSSSADYSPAADSAINKHASEYEALITRIKAMDSLAVKTKAGIADIKDIASQTATLAARDYPSITQPTFDITKDSSQTRPDVCSAWFALGDYYHNLYAFTGASWFQELAERAYAQGRACRARL